MFQIKILYSSNSIYVNPIERMANQNQRGNPAAMIT
ncbi:hypothetical protein S101395_01003 [Bacillus sonorensis]|uniref:Uncharacterized protein n=1 Tax=Bacillus sonorensis TaxID=119858 RepID=A0ABN5ABN2_9BACI|nr:hypothetical protein S101395_01003 [Bacillus sonorensis]